MFEGKNFRIRHKGRNTYEFRSAFTCVTKTGPEVLALMLEELTLARRQQVELIQARHVVSEAIAKEQAHVPAPLHVAAAAPCAVVPLPPLSPSPSPAAHAPEPAAEVPMRNLRAIPSTHAVAPSRTTRSTKNKVYAVANDNAIAPGSEKTPKRRPSGLAYLNMVRQQMTLEQATG